MRVRGEKKCCCDNSNVIDFDTLVNLGMKKTSIGWYFKDETMFSPLNLKYLLLNNSELHMTKLIIKA